MKLVNYSYLKREVEMIKKLDLGNRDILNQIVQLQLTAYRAEADIIGYDEIPPLKDTIETLSKCEETFYGYYMEETLAGLIAYEIEGYTLDICRVAISPHFFRRGIAQELIKFVEKLNNDVKKIMVSTGKENNPAVSLYLKLGFQKVKDISISKDLCITMFEKYLRGDFKVNRCDWCGDDEQYIKYHDEEWGVPVHDDRVHFEFLVLESAQSGLSWITILRKRENYRLIYNNFDPEKIAKYGEEKVEEMILNSGIVRNRKKIEASINNAKVFLQIQKEFGSYDKYIWSFVDNKPIVNGYSNISEVPATTELSDKIAKDFKKRGFKFLGSTTIYAYLQAVGIVDDHLDYCFKKNISN